jgi:hypothetical protein
MIFYKSYILVLVAFLSNTPLLSNATEPLFKALIKPKSIGTYELKITTSNDIPQKYYLGSSRIKGVNKKLTKIITPPPRKYWVISQSNKDDFRLMKSGKSLKGKCLRIDWEHSNKDGIAVVADLKTPTYNHHGKKPLAFVTCNVRGPINSTNPELTVISKGSNKLLPNYSYPMKLPIETKSFELEIVMDNEKHIVTSSQNNELFKVSVQDKDITLLTFSK